MIQPGSYNLRIGRASDAYPITVPHCIARKVNSTGILDSGCSWFLREECAVSHVPTEFWLSYLCLALHSYLFIGIINMFGHFVIDF